MRILAIDSSSLVASAAVTDDDILIAEYTVNFKKTHSQTLLPMIDELTKIINLDMNTIDAVAVAGGPGSFTGLRIGSATAKGFGLALNKPIINVPTLEAMAYNIYDTNKIICPIMDARRNQVYTGLYTFIDGKFTVINQQMAISVEELVSILNNKHESVIFVGDGIPVYRDILTDKLQVESLFAPSHLNRQRAGAVAALASDYYKHGRFETAAEHIPQYLRQSQAERERQEKQNQQI
ncbi:MAG: tRNA (adenosine(37)-N6)-threonylcarbamoyltransferase complex dimerization subunit type 1 TsaB [Eubacterium sp.]